MKPELINVARDGSRQHQSFQSFFQRKKIMGANKNNNSDSDAVSKNNKSVNGSERDDDDSPRRIVAEFAPYEDRFPLIRVPREGLAREIKSAARVYSEWANLVFKAFYGSGPSGVLAAPSSSSGQGGLGHWSEDKAEPTEAVVEWSEKIMAAWETPASVAAAATAAAAAPPPPKPATASKGGKSGKGGKKGKKDAPPDATLASAPSDPVLDPNPDNFATTLSALTLEWLEQPSRLTVRHHIEPCGFTDMVTHAAEWLRPMTSEELATIHDQWAATRAEIGYDENDDDSDDDGGPIETIYHVVSLDPKKNVLVAEAARVMSLLQRDEEIQIIDPEELLRPPMVERERDITEAEITRLHAKYAKALSDARRPVWARAHTLLRELQAIGTARAAALAGIHAAAVEIDTLKSFDDHWAEVTNSFKSRRKAVDAEALASVNARFTSFVDRLLEKHTAIMRNMQTAANRLIPVAKSMHDISMSTILGLTNLPDGNDPFIMKEAAAMRNMMAPLDNQATLMLGQLAEGVRVELADMVEAADAIRAQWTAGPDPSPMNVGHRLDKAARGDLRKAVKKLEAMALNLVTNSEKHIKETVIPAPMILQRAIAALTCVMTEGELREVRALASINRSFEAEFAAVLSKRDTTVNLFKDGLEAGIRALDLSLRNVILDEMASIAATERTKEKERALFGLKAAAAQQQPAAQASQSSASTLRPTSAAPAPTAAAAPVPAAASASAGAATGKKKNKAKNKGKGNQDKPTSPSPPAAEETASTTSIDGVERVFSADILAMMPIPGGRTPPAAASLSPPISASPARRATPTPAPEPTLSAADIALAAAAQTQSAAPASDDHGAATPFEDSSARKSPVPAKRAPAQASKATPSPAPVIATPAPKATPTPAPPVAAPPAPKSEKATKKEKAAKSEKAVHTPKVPVVAETAALVAESSNSLDDNATAALAELTRENEELRAALEAKEEQVQRLDSTTRQLVAEHTRLVQLRQKDNEASQKAIAQLRSQLARMAADLATAYAAPMGGGGAADDDTTVGSEHGSPSSSSPLVGVISRPFRPYDGGHRASTRTISAPWTAARASAPPPARAAAAAAASSSSAVLSELNHDSVPVHAGQETAAALASAVRPPKYIRGARPGKWAGSNSTDGGSSSTTTATAEGAAAASAAAVPTVRPATVRCARCFARGHTSDACTLQCTVCGDTGHLGRSCPRKDLQQGS
ncbi:hypothetical protein BC828DRAFT_254154 [Blastocladiella britannica]|nr:hypothetical protein BC828DRAFT_254154 [Blastocladiella britannica]